MLHKSFKSAKCKSSLKMASSRIKVLKNKKEAQVRELKRELAKLLESGQDRNARIRVEHVVREEKMKAAYELIEIYCELIAARLPVIESQKSCPIDLKEAVASVIYAAPRCADIEELQDVRKHFTAKYGKEFITAAVELRPNSGVGRMLVEKLSIVAPDGPTKIKILSAIAEEHNIKWDPVSFEERDSKPPNDLLNGPNSFEKAGKMHPELPNVPASKVHAPPSCDRKQDPAVNSFDQISRPSTSSQNYSSTDVSGNKTPSTSQPEVRSSGTGPERMEVRRSFSGDGNAYSFGRQNWNMEFKDATSAAQAAAESAELASMAARAAAELSTQERITRMHSFESQKSNAHNVRNGGPRKYDASKLPDEFLGKDSATNSFNDRHSKLHNEQIRGNKHNGTVDVSEKFQQDGLDSRNKSAQSASLRSSKASIDNDTLVNSFKKVDRYSQDSSSEDEAVKANESLSFAKMNIQKQSSKSDVEFITGRRDGLESEKSNMGQERSRKQSSSISQHSHSGTSVGIDQERIPRDDRQTSSYDNADVVYDDGGTESSDDDYKLDKGPKYDIQESKLYFPSPDRTSPTRLSRNVDSWSPKRHVSGSSEKSTSQSHHFAERHFSQEFPEKLTKSAGPSKPVNLSPLTYDDSDGPNSEGEDELDKAWNGGIIGSNPRKQDVYSRNSEQIQSLSHGLKGSSFSDKRNSSSDRKPWEYSSSDNLDSVKVWPKNHPRTEINADIQEKTSVGQLSATQQSPRRGKSRLEMNDGSSDSNFRSPLDEKNSQQASKSSMLSSVHGVKDNVHRPQSHDTLKDYGFPNQSNSENEKELKLGTLTGGFRNKGFRHPPYIQSPSDGVSSSSKEVAEDNSSSTIDQSNASFSVKSSIGSGVRRKVSNRSSSRASIKHYDSDSDTSEEDFQQQEEPYNQKTEREVKAKSSLRTPVTYFDSNNGDSKGDLPEQTSTSIGLSGSGISRRTKPPPPSSETNSSSKFKIGSEASVNSNSDGRKRRNTGSQPVITGHGGRSEQSSSTKVAASELMTEFKASSREEKSSSMKQSSSILQQPVIPGSTGNQKTSNSISKALPGDNYGNQKKSNSRSKTLPGDNSEKRASHVHPKLPDYDTIAAKFQAMRQNRQ